jgi:hypothetical protein
MAVQIIDDTTADDGNLDTPAAEAAPPPAAPAPAPEPHLPEKFKGKSLEDVAKAYEQLEQLAGRQGAELGEMRRTFDEVIRSSLPKRDEKPADPPAESTDDDTAFFLNPRQAIAKAVEEHPLVKELRETQTKSQQERAKQTFDKKHPDAAEIVKEPEFRQWIESSPVRSELMMRAHRSFDVAAGDELFSTWKQLQGNKVKQGEPPPADKTAAEAVRQEAVRASTVPSGNAAPADNGAGKKIFRRTDLIKLQQVDPDRYAAMGDEILLAYLEKRVR